MIDPTGTREEFIAEVARLRADFDDCNLTREHLKQQVIKLRAALEEAKLALYGAAQYDDDPAWDAARKIDAFLKALTNEQEKASKVAEAADAKLRAANERAFAKAIAKQEGK
jgi:hypothetical protein